MNINGYMASLGYTKYTLLAIYFNQNTVYMSLSSNEIISLLKNEFLFA